MKDISSALIRSYGFLGFMLFGLGSMQFGDKIFGFDAYIWDFPFSALGGKGMTLIVLSLFLALTGLFTGWGIGAAIKIQHKNAEDIRINPLLLYGANGSFMWMFSIIILSLVIGKEGATGTLVLPDGTQLFLLVIGLGILGSLLISLMMFLSQYFRSNS